MKFADRSPGKLTPVKSQFDGATKRATGTAISNSTRADYFAGLGFVTKSEQEANGPPVRPPMKNYCSCFRINPDYSLFTPVLQADPASLVCVAPLWYAPTLRYEALAKKQCRHFGARI